MITEAKNKAGRPRKKKAEKSAAEPTKEAEALVLTDADAPHVRTSEIKGSCPACHTTVTLSQQYRCQNCGVYGCEECGFDPKAKICSKCGAKR